MGRASSTQKEKRNACRSLVGKPKGKRPLGRHKHKWEHNIKMELGEIGWSIMICLRIETRSELLLTR
jgi:hypothetical protein